MSHTFPCDRCQKPFGSVELLSECPNCAKARDRVEADDQWARMTNTAEIKAAANRLFGTRNHQLPRRPKHRA